jgi:hypothetical protein
VNLFSTPYKPTLLEEITGGIMVLICLAGMTWTCGWEGVVVLVLLGVWS